MRVMETATCRWCRFAQLVEGHHPPLLICVRSRSGRRSCRATHPQNTCDEFKAGRDAFGLMEEAADLYSGERLVPVKGGPFARVDAADYEKVAGFEWCAVHYPANCYAMVKARGLAMHRVIMDAAKGWVVDHIDHDGMNNTRKNLRLCRKSQNNRNLRPHRDGSSRYKGVSWSKLGRSWTVRICRDGKILHLGCFKDEVQAARAYDEKARELFGEFAYLNFPGEEG
ncbi:MAG: HNH endonuclease [Phycisphaerae bacterium]|nr:HNH endonuclease [Phycisphaerae bacterium]